MSIKETEVANTMPLNLTQSFDLWGVKHSPASPSFKRCCLERFGDGKQLKSVLKCLPAHQSELWRDGRFRCLLWDELTIIEELSARATTQYMPIATLGDSSWLALDFKDNEASHYPAIGVFYTDLCGEDNWAVLSPGKFRRLSRDYADYLQLIFNNPDDDLL